MTSPKLPPKPFDPPPYPHDRLAPIIAAASERHGDIVDLSIGTPCDPPSKAVLDVLADPDLAKSYPPSVGTPVLLKAASEWFDRRLSIEIPTERIGVCVGTKELVAGIPHWLRLADPHKDTVLYPAVSYPTYAMGAMLAGCRAVAVPLAHDGSLDLGSIDDDDVSRALCLWSNSPSNPTGDLDDLKAVGDWGRTHGVSVFSDECYLEFTWSDRRGAPGGSPAESILAHGLDGVVAVNSLSKRSNLAGLRLGFFAGDEKIVRYLNEIRKHSGLMVPGPVQLAGVVALGDQAHVETQRKRYFDRMQRLAKILGDYGLTVTLPEGGFYLWINSEPRDGWALTEDLALDLGVIVSPGEFYGPDVSGYIRVAAVQPEDRLETIATRLERV